jgi:nucleoid-associated protein YgaU
MTSTRARLVIVLGGATVAGAALWTAGAGRAVGGPSEASWDGAQVWYAHAGVGAAAVAGLRLVGLLAAGWLGVAAVAQLVASVSSGAAVRHVADVVSPRVVRRVAQGMASLSVAVALAGPPAPPDPVGTAVMERIDVPPTTTTTATAGPAVPPPVTEPEVRAPAREEPTQVVVAPGDSFWSLAEAAVAAHPRPPAVGDYWRRFVDANRDRLVDPANPDLLYPGQTLTLPLLDG